MEFIVKGIEDKKNKEITQLRQQMRLENELTMKKIVHLCFLLKKFFCKKKIVLKRFA